MRVEVVDRRNPILVRVASVQEVKEHQVLVHFDGWPEMYDYWVDDDSPDLKPPGWCSRTGGTLQPPFGEQTLVVGLSSSSRVCLLPAILLFWFIPPFEKFVVYSARFCPEPL